MLVGWIRPTNVALEKLGGCLFGHSRGISCSYVGARRDSREAIGAAKSLLGSEIGCLDVGRPIEYRKTHSGNCTRGFAGSFAGSQVHFKALRCQSVPTQTNARIPAKVERKIAMN